jgi:hypothetical protein
LVTPPAAWPAFLAMAREMFRGFASLQRQVLQQPAHAADPVSRLMPLFLPRAVLARAFADIGVPLPEDAPESPPHPANRVAALLLERRLPFLLAEGATLLATMATGLETPA